MKVSVSGKLFTVGLISFWYASNIGVLLLNKYLLSNHGFRYPIFLTLCHMMACSILSYVAIAWLKMVPMQTVRSRVQFVKISSLGLIFCLSVVGGNISLRYLPVSFNQAVGATTPFFTAVFAYLMTLRREGWLTYVTLLPVVAGVIIASGVSLLSYLFELKNYRWIPNMLMDSRRYTQYDKSGRKKNIDFISNVIRRIKKNREKLEVFC